MKKNSINKKNMAEKFRLFLRDCFGEEFSRTFKVIAINCLQFGDTGKGKIVHLLAMLWAHIVVRCNGGDNAGHTIIHNNEEMALHLLPCGIVFDGKGVINVIGSEVAFYPKSAVDEIKLIHSKGLTTKNLKIALNAPLLLPHHILDDRLGELNAGKTKIGSTGKGIQPCYTDKVARRGLIVNDILNPATLRAKLEKSMRPFLAKLNKMSVSDLENVRTIMFHEHLESGLYYSFDLDLIVAKYAEYGNFLRQYICDTDNFLRERVGKANILLEGSQGRMLGIRTGTYPYVTSSDCTPAGLAAGAGLMEHQIDISFGIVKGTMTRVGKGPFPTEMGGKKSDEWCNSIGSREKETEMYFDADMNDPDEYIQGIAFRRAGGEYGATTKRPRRTGWNDLPMLRYALDSGASDLIFTKFDVLKGVKTIKICYSYLYIGPDFNYGELTLKAGMILKKAIVLPEVLDYCSPLYKEFPGWKCDIRRAKDVFQLPQNLIDILKYIQEETKATPRIISVGPGPEETIFVGTHDLELYIPKKQLKLA